MLHILRNSTIIDYQTRITEIQALLTTPSDIQGLSRTCMNPAITNSLKHLQGQVTKIPELQG